MTSIHHSVIIVEDLDNSVRFYAEGLGLAVLTERSVVGDWPTLFDAPTTTLRVVFLGDPESKDDHAGVLELNSFAGAVRSAQSSSPSTGLFLISFFVDVDAVLGRLSRLGLGGTPRRIEQSTPNGQVTIATVRDPDGVTILLTPGSITQSR
jgi:catechol 2,3-dioxygenase-like lactoylglutathione lyase family enzyme